MQNTDATQVVGILQFAICKPIKANIPWDDYG